jgi:hypothetical protein
MKTIMVQMSDKQWTMEAMHLASALARNSDSKLVLLRLVLATNPGLLGWGVPLPSVEEQRQLQECATVAEDYGVEFCVQPMHYISSSEALAQAVELFEIDVLFANIPRSSIPLWQKFRLWNMKRLLGNCCLYTLTEEQPLRIKEPIPAGKRNIETA